MSEETDKFRAQYGPWALIAGASEGIGLAFAEQLAALGINLILLSRSSEKLEKAAAEILHKHSIEIRVVVADLSSDDCMGAIQVGTEGLEVGLVVYNAGAVHGAALFLDDPVEDSLSLMRLNCQGPILLAHHFGQPMRERKRGGMIFLSSMAAFGGGSYIASYAGTKAFDIIFPQSLWHEMTQFNVDVLCLVAGATRTPAMARSGLDFESEGGPTYMDAAEVASEGLANICNGPLWVAGEGNRAVAEMIAAVPRADLVEMLSQSTAQMYGLPYVPARPHDEK